MTWVCDSLDLHMQDPANLDDCPQPMFLLTYMIDNEMDDARHRFYSTGEITMNAAGQTMNTDRTGNDVWCAECGESATNREGEDLLEHYVDHALNIGWLICTHGDGDNPVILNCDACLEEHVNAEAHRGLTAGDVFTIEQFREYRQETIRIEQNLGDRRNTVPRRMPPNIRTADGAEFDWNDTRHRYERRRPPPRTLHALIGDRDGA